VVEVQASRRTRLPYHRVSYSMAIFAAPPPSELALMVQRCAVRMHIIEGKSRAWGCIGCTEPCETTSLVVCVRGPL
jgi:hypothetical protein